MLEFRKDVFLRILGKIQSQSEESSGRNEKESILLESLKIVNEFPSEKIKAVRIIKDLLELERLEDLDKALEILISIYTSGCDGYKLQTQSSNLILSEEKYYIDVDEKTKTAILEIFRSKIPPNTQQEENILNFICGAYQIASTKGKLKKIIASTIINCVSRFDWEQVYYFYNHVCPELKEVIAKGLINHFSAVEIINYLGEHNLQIMEKSKIISELKNALMSETHQRIRDFISGKCEYGLGVNGLIATMLEDYDFAALLSSFINVSKVKETLDYDKKQMKRTSSETDEQFFSPKIKKFLKRLINDYKEQDYCITLPHFLRVFFEEEKKQPSPIISGQEPNIDKIIEHLAIKEKQGGSIL